MAEYMAVPWEHHLRCDCVSTVIAEGYYTVSTTTNWEDTTGPWVPVGRVTVVGTLAGNHLPTTPPAPPLLPTMAQLRLG